MRSLILSLALAIFLAPLASAQYTDTKDEGQALLQVIDESLLATSGVATSDEFYLGKSEYFSVEMIASATGSVNYDLILQYEKADGSGWADDENGDLVTAGSDAWKIIDLTASYTTKKLRLKLTNDDSGALTAAGYLHRDAPRRNGVVR